MLIATPLLPFLDPANIAMLFLLAVVLIAARLGRGPLIVASIVGVAAFDFFFVLPRFSFAVNDFQYLVAFSVMLAVGVLIGHMTDGLCAGARMALRRESRPWSLYEYARELSSALQAEQIFDTTRNFIKRTFHARPFFCFRTIKACYALRLFQRRRAPEALHLDVLDIGVVQWAFDHKSPAGKGADTLPSSCFPSCRWLRWHAACAMLRIIFAFHATV